MEERETWRQIMRSEMPDELRVVSLLEEEDGAFTVEERSDGEQTLFAFDSLSCVRRVSVQSQDAKTALQALGSRDKTASLVLEELFSPGDAFLSDVMDRLDAAGVPYAYTVTCGNDLQLRTQEGPEARRSSIISSK